MLAHFSRRVLRHSTSIGYRTLSTDANDVMHGTTILSVRKGSKVVLISDGQVTQGSMCIKANARKVRRIGDGVVAGFAGATADAMTLFERLESKIEEHSGQLMRSAVELAKLWRTDRALRRLNATIIVVDSKLSLTITGMGDVIEPQGGILSIGSGSPMALAAAKALYDNTDLDAEQIALKAMHIASDLDIYTNKEFTIETLEATE